MGLGPDLPQVLRQRGPAGRRLQDSEAAEASVGQRARHVKLQLPVAETVHLLENKDPQDLAPAHSPTVQSFRTGNNYECSQSGDVS